MLQPDSSTFRPRYGIVRRYYTISYVPWAAKHFKSLTSHLQTFTSIEYLVKDTYRGIIFEKLIDYAFHITFIIV